MWIKFGCTTQLYVFENLTMPLGVFAKTFTTDMKPRKRQAKKRGGPGSGLIIFPYSLKYPSFYLIWFQEQKLSNLSPLLIKLLDVILFWPDGDQETAQLP